MYLCKVARTTFPEPTGAMINMMPFVIGDYRSVPDEYAQYWPMISECSVEQEQNGKVGYLSINESMVEVGRSQRRSGLHTDGFAALGWGGGGWGRGENRKGGIYLASDAPDSCMAWDQNVEPGRMGDCEHLRDSLGEGVVLDPETIYWITDRTPHESLALKRPTFRRWFRLVTSEVDVWYRKHSTGNRLGVVAPCKISEYDKF